MKSQAGVYDSSNSSKVVLAYADQGIQYQRGTAVSWELLIIQIRQLVLELLRLTLKRESKPLILDHYIRYYKSNKVVYCL